MSVALRKCRVCALTVTTTYELPLFRRSYTHSSGYTTICKKCHSKQGQARQKELRLINKEWIEKEIGGWRCNHCNYTYNSMTPFDFHHPDPTIKEYGGVAGLMSWSNTTKLKQEVAKCILLCKNCHAIEHERLRNE